MTDKTSRPAARLAVLMVAVVAVGFSTGCGSQNEGTEAAGDAKKLAARARQVAAAWDGSTAAAAWRAGYHPMGDVVQLPRGGLKSPADKQAYAEQSFILRSKLPATRPADGRVAWNEGTALTRPLLGADEAYKTLSGDHAGESPHLTVTDAKLGEMVLATSRGPATVPAWLFTLAGYDSPLKRAAAVPSKLPQPPIKRRVGGPGFPLSSVSYIASDGRSVTVLALHGSCDEGPAVKALETRGSVVLSNSVKNPKEGVCSKDAKEEHVTVKLDQPLDDRVLLDATTGRPVPYQAGRGPTPSWS
ncbi:hypothetical protein [Streptomyces boninensis]|uniref:hypothetical protein n=1 Tax=Streptomyces boninensis TaxID=2039455 RepID=UPI003B20DC9E